MARVLLKQVTKTYAGGVHAVNGVDVDIADGEFIVLVGPSGCGKSTTLRMVAGLEEISGGEIHIGPRVVNDVPPKDRDIAMVFQNYALYPHMSVYRNMAFGLTLRQMPGLFERLKNPARAREIRNSIDAKVRQAAAMLEITHLLDRKPKALSGGQRQRVAVGRAIVREPACFLFDEPLSNLDAKLRVTTRAQLKQLHQRLKTTTIYVTHDQEEAMTLGDRIVVMKDGLVQQQDTPIRVYQSPANRFVASFIGMPPMNMFDGILKSRDGRLVFEEGQLANATRVEQRSDEPEVFAGEVTTPGSGFVVPFDGAMAERLASHANKHVVLGIRPEHLTIQPNGTSVAATVEVTEPLGNAMDLYFRTALHDHKVARVEADPAVAIGQSLSLHVDPRKVHVFEPGPTGRNLSLA